jgi:hypothetical protein
MPQPRGHTVVIQAIHKKLGRKKKVSPEGWDYY